MNLKNFLFAIAFLIPHLAYANLVLGAPPCETRQHANVEIGWPQEIHTAFNKLSSAEQLLIAYVSKAAEPLNYLAFTQLHRYAWPLVNLFSALEKGRSRVEAAVSIRDLNVPFDAKQFFDEVHDYLTFLSVFHGHYVSRLHKTLTGKRTPASLKLTLLTPENIDQIAEFLEVGHLFLPDEEFRRSLFDDTFEPKLVEPGNIEKSVSNAYPQRFTQQHYEMVAKMQDRKQAKRVNRYAITNDEPTVSSFTVTTDTSGALQRVNYWLSRARMHAQKFPEHFDEHFVAAIDAIIAFNEDGQESTYKTYLKHLVATKSRIHFTLGFIMRCIDPKGEIGFATADVVIKSLSQEQEAALSAGMHKIEKQLPFEPQFRRHLGENASTATLPNIVAGLKFLGAGRFGPETLSAGYELPLDLDVLAEVGAKPVIYREEAPLPSSYERMAERRAGSMTSFRNEWFSVHDPAEDLLRTLRYVLTVVHETIGHGSGAFGEHTYVDGDTLESSVLKQTMKIGDSVQLTEKLAQELLKEHYGVLEEIRAEMIATYVVIAHTDRLKALGLFGQWGETLTLSELQEWMLYTMTHSAIKASVSQGDVIQNPYILASHILLRSFIAANACRIDDSLDVGLINVEAVLPILGELVERVQRLKSTADRVGTKALIEEFGRLDETNPMAAQFKSYKDRQLEKNKTQPITSSQGSALVFPYFATEGDEIVNVIWPKSLVEQLFWQTSPWSQS